MSDAPARPVPRARTARAEGIVAAARAILEAEGPEGLTMRRLAEALGLRAPSLYKHFADKQAVEVALIEDGLFEVGDATHAAVDRAAPAARRRPVAELLATYRAHCVAHPEIYRLATRRALARDDLLDGLEEWSGNPWFRVTGDPARAQALWAFAHGMVTLETDRRFPPGSDLDRTWAAGAEAFAAAPPGPAPTTRVR